MQKSCKRTNRGEAFEDSCWSYSEPGDQKLKCMAQPYEIWTTGRFALGTGTRDGTKIGLRRWSRAHSRAPGRRYTDFCTNYSKICTEFEKYARIWNKYFSFFWKTIILRGCMPQAFFYGKSAFIFSELCFVVKCMSQAFFCVKNVYLVFLQIMFFVQCIPQAFFMKKYFFVKR